MLKRTILAVLIAAVIVAPALAIFGLGDIVFDPTNYQEAIQQFVQLSEQFGGTRGESPCLQIDKVKLLLGAQRPWRHLSHPANATGGAITVALIDQVSAR